MLSRACAFFPPKTNLKSTYLEDINFSFVILRHAVYFFKWIFKKFQVHKAGIKLAWLEKHPIPTQRRYNKDSVFFQHCPRKPASWEGAMSCPINSGFWLSHSEYCTLTKSPRMLPTPDIYCKSSFQSWNTQWCITWNWVGEGKSLDGSSRLCPQVPHGNRTPLSVGWIRLRWLLADFGNRCFVKRRI